MPTIDGAYAYYAGLGLDANPHAAGTAQHEAWETEWLISAMLAADDAMALAS